MRPAAHKEIRGWRIEIKGVATEIRGGQRP